MKPRLPLPLLLATVALLGAGPALSAPAPAAPASDPIKITFADNRVQAASSVRVSGNSLLATIQLGNGVRGDVGYPLANVRKLEMPPPPQIKVARDLIAAGKATEALAQLNPVVALHTSLRAIPGNYWAASSLAKVDTLLALDLDREAEVLINQLNAGTKDPDLLRTARMALASLWLRKGKETEALAVFDQVIVESKNPATIARAWQLKGDALLAKENYDAALLAYLRIPTFYSGEATLQPPALLGSARAYEGLGNLERARETLEQLGTEYASSPEAATSKNDLKRIQEKIKPS